MHDDVTLQELIVRALTGMDARARQSLDNAAARDPGLRQFCAELDDVVNLLAGSKDWRSETPSAELTAKIRAAVAEKLPAAPPHFRKVMLEEDLGRGGAIRKLMLAIAICALGAGAAVWIWSERQQAGPELKLSGRVAFDAPFKDGSIEAWERAGGGEWQADKDGLRAEGGGEVAACFLAKSFDASEALAFVVDVSVPGLEDGSSVLAFIAEAGTAGQPPLKEGSRPARALSLEIGRDGLLLAGPDGAPLRSRPLSNAEARFYRVRLEHLGLRVRVLVNGDVFFDGPVARALQGPLHPGMRAAGAQKGAVRFNAARIER